MTFFPQERSLTLYEGPMSSSVGNSDPKICFNSTTDVHYQVGGDDDDDDVDDDEADRDDDNYDDDDDDDDDDLDDDHQLQLRAGTGSHLQSLWGSIALGLSIFGILIVRYLRS